MRPDPDIGPGRVFHCAFAATVARIRSDRRHMGLSPQVQGYSPGSASSCSSGCSADGAYGILAYELREAGSNCTTMASVRSPEISHIEELFTLTLYG